MRRNLQGKRILITGASGGIGRELAVAAGSAGSRLLLTSNEAGPLQALADELRARGIEVVHIAGDITSPQDRVAIFNAADRFSGLDILINNAGVGANSRFIDEDPAVLRRIMEVNFFATTECCRAAISLLSKGTEPLIVNISSMFGRRGVPTWSSYCASKFAVCGFSEALRTELASLPIDVMTVLPGVTNTGFGGRLLSGSPIDLSWGMDTRQVAETVLSGIRKNRRELLVGRDSKWLVLLNRIFPDRLFPTLFERRFVGFARGMTRPGADAQSIDPRSLRARRIAVIRAAEKTLPPTVFCAILFPFGVVRLLKSCGMICSVYQWKKRMPGTLYSGITKTGTLRAGYNRFAMQMSQHWPDRLREPRWRRRCQMFGEEILQASLATGRPVILASLHYGGLRELFFWLRSRGYSTAAISATPGRDPYRLYYDALGDVANGLENTPSIFGTSLPQLYAVRDFLRHPGHLLLVAIDVPDGHRPAVIQLDGPSIVVQLGAFSLAAGTGAIVIPCLFRADRRMGCQIHIKTPVPDELLANRNCYSTAAEHVLRQLQPLIRECPEQADMQLVSGSNNGAA